MLKREIFALQMVKFSKLWGSTWTLTPNEWDNDADRLVVEALQAKWPYKQK